MDRVLKSVVSLGYFRGRGTVTRAILRLMRTAPSVYGPRLIARPRDFTNWASIIGLYGDELMELIRDLPEDGVFLDIGANTGVFSLAAAARLPRGRAICFEPNPLIYRDLLANIALNANVNVIPVNAAIGAETGIATLAFDRRHSGMGRIDAGGDRATNRRTVMVFGPDLLAPLGALLRSGSRRLCKIDTEGFEMAVAEALEASGLLASLDSVWIEIDEAMLARFGAEPAQLYALFERNGFTATKGLGTRRHYDELFRQNCG